MYTGPNIVREGLILHLDAANRKSYVNGTTVWNDLSGRGNNGTLINGPTFSSANGGSIVFDGINDYVNLGTSTTPSNTDFSYSVWISTNQTGGIIFGADFCGDAGGHYMYAGAGIFGFRVIGGSSVIITANSYPYISNNWYNVTCTKSSSTMSIYVNGILSGTGVSPNITNPNLFTRYIGVRGGVLSSPASCGSTYLAGNISMVVMYSKTLTRDEVSKNYNATKGRFNL